jgi:hypothetical protein
MEAINETKLEELENPVETNEEKNSNLSDNNHNEYRYGRWSGPEGRE